MKDQIMTLFKTKGYSKPEPVKTVYGGGKKQLEGNIIKSIRNLFILKKTMKKLKIEYLEILNNFLNKKKKIIIN